MSTHDIASPHTGSTKPQPNAADGLNNLLADALKDSEELKDLAQNRVSVLLGDTSEEAPGPTEPDSPGILGTCTVKARLIKENLEIIRVQVERL